MARSGLDSTYIGMSLASGAGRFGRQIRVGILVDSDTVDRWVFEMLESIESSHCAEIVQVVANGAPTQRRLHGIARLRHLSRRFAYTLYSRVDRILSRVEHDPFEKRSIRTLLKDAHWLTVVPERSGFVDRISAQDLDILKEDCVDVYLRLGFGIIKGGILSAAEFGVWSYHHGDNRVNRGMPPGFWETYLREPVTGITLQILSDELDGGQVIYRSSVKTNDIYVYRNQCEAFWKSAVFVPRMLCRLYDLGAGGFREQVSLHNADPVIYSRRLFTTPTNTQVLDLLLRTAYRILRRTLTRIFITDQWQLRYRIGGNDSMDLALWRFDAITPPEDRFWADPFVIRRDGRYHLFFEQMMFGDTNGTIAHLSIGDDGDVSPAQVVLAENFHLSYPFVFEYEGETYLMPECSEERVVQLYRCTEFPYRWEKHTVLLDDIEAVDPTLFFHADRWWLFVGKREHVFTSFHDELHLFHTDDLFSGNWTPHPLNPVVSDVRCARPAGNIIEQGGSIYRPAQDGGRGYGGGITLKKISKLSESEYSEYTVSHVAPTWNNNLIGVHTLNREGRLAVIDTLVRRTAFDRLGGRTNTAKVAD